MCTEYEFAQAMKRASKFTKYGEKDMEYQDERLSHVYVWKEEDDYLQVAALNGGNCYMQKLESRLPMEGFAMLTREQAAKVISKPSKNRTFDPDSLPKAQRDVNEMYAFIHGPCLDYKIISGSVSERGVLVPVEGFALIFGALKDFRPVVFQYIGLGPKKDTLAYAISAPQDNVTVIAMPVLNREEVE